MSTADGPGRLSLARAVELLLSGAQQDFPVVDARTVVGILTAGMC
jgi:hypothetical protein